MATSLVLKQLFASNLMTGLFRPTVARSSRFLSTNSVHDCNNSSDDCTYTATLKCYKTLKNDSHYEIPEIPESIKQGDTKAYLNLHIRPKEHQEVSEGVTFTAKHNLLERIKCYELDFKGLFTSVHMKDGGVNLSFPKICGGINKAEIKFT